MSLRSKKSLQNLQDASKKRYGFIEKEIPPPLAPPVVRIKKEPAKVLQIDWDKINKWARMR